MIAVGPVTVPIFNREAGMTRNKKIVMAAAAVIALALAPVAAAASTGSQTTARHPMIIHVVEHAITDTVQMFHPPKKSLGDVLGFHNPVFNASNTRQIATDNGYCIRTVATGNTEWECTWTTLLPGGHLTVEGPFLDNGTNTTLAITGGTGRFAGAEGSMLLHATGHPAGSEFDFIFTLTPLTATPAIGCRRPPLPAPDRAEAYERAASLTLPRRSPGGYAPSPTACGRAHRLACRPGRTDRAI
jgi:allene oxide cyclase